MLDGGVALGVALGGVSVIWAVEEKHRQIVEWDVCI